MSSLAAHRKVLQLNEMICRISLIRVHSHVSEGLPSTILQRSSHFFFGMTNFTSPQSIRIVKQRLFIILTLLLIGSLQVFAADPVPSDRLPYGGTWEGKVGVSGGIPNRSTVYQTLTSSATASQINAAIANCPSGQVVLLQAGTYSNLGGSLTLAKSNVTLRGAIDANGAPRTILQNTSIVIGSQDGWDAGDSSKYTTSTISSGATRGSTTVTVSGTPSRLSPGMLMWISAPSSTQVTGGGNWSDWFGTRPFTQVVKVTSVSGSNISFTPAMNADYLSGTIQCHWRDASDTISLSGIENLSFTVTGAGSASHYIEFWGTDQCWAKNCKTYDVQSGRYHIYIYLNYRTEIRHCDMAHMRNLTSSTYCILPLHSSNLLIEDNYFHDAPNIMPMFGLNGSAFAYNYINALPYNPAGWLSQIVFFHGSHNHYNLMEGNWCAATWNDEGGGSRNNIWFRNRMRGYDTDASTGPATGDTQCISLATNHNNFVAAGNVLGENGIQTVVKRTFTGVEATPGDCIYNIHTSANTTFTQIANYNTVNHAIPSVVSSLLGSIREALGAGDALVTSYLHSTKPSFFGDRPWPWCDPNNYLQSNTATNLPAAYRAINGFDPTGAGAGGGGDATAPSVPVGGAPDPPQGLRVIAP